MKAVISPKNPMLIATLDPAIIKTGKMNLYELAVANGFVGSFDAFLAQFILSNPKEFISTDPANTLTLGTDNKLFTKHFNPLTKEDW